MQSILSSFRFPSPPVSEEPYGSGHINGTFRIVCANGAAYILQRVNTAVFREPEALMRNIERVTAHLRTKNSDPRAVLQLLPAHDGRCYATEHGEYWRVFAFVENSVCFQRADETLFRKSGFAFGRFIGQLADFPAAELAETIPHFHDTPARFDALLAAVGQDAAGRRGEIARDIDLACSYEPFTHTLADAQRRGELPLRVTHNDTKINNILFDRDTSDALCVIDLDTVMPGLMANDFGDAIRFGASTAEEDERDLSRVRLSLPLYKAYAEGFLSACGESVTEPERASLPVGAKMMTYENGIRFLADHLNGDIYFHISRPGQNLDRARTQFRLLAEMDALWDKMRRIVDRAGR